MSMLANDSYGYMGTPEFYWRRFTELAKRKLSGSVSEIGKRVAAILHSDQNDSYLDSDVSDNYRAFEAKRVRSHRSMAAAVNPDALCAEVEQTIARAKAQAAENARLSNAVEQAVNRDRVKAVVEGVLNNPSNLYVSNETITATPVQRKLPTFVEIRQKAKTASVSYEEAVELCGKLIQTMYRDYAEKGRRLDLIDEERMMALMDDYALAADNEAVDFLRLFVRDRSQSVLVRERVLVQLSTKNADPLQMKQVVVRTIMDQFFRRWEQESRVPRLISHG